MSNMPRMKKMMTFAIDPELLKQFEEWLAAQEVAMKKTAVIESALREWMARRPVAKKKQK